MKSSSINWNVGGVAQGGEMPQSRCLAGLFTLLSEKANLYKQYAQRTVRSNATALQRLCRRRTSMLASYRGLVEWTMHRTVALGYCLYRCALSESGLLRKLLKSNNYTKLSWETQRSGGGISCN